MTLPDLNIQQSLMPTHQQLRHFYRHQLRKQQINIKRADLRNLMLCLASSHQKQCPMCVHQWITAETDEKMVSLLVDIFNKQNVCTAHAELLFSKILQILFGFPRYFPHFISKQRSEPISMYSRKVILLFEIIDNELLMGKTELQEEVLRSFEERGQFIDRLLDTAYGLNQGCFEQDQTLNGLCDAKRISYNTILFVFQKYPLLFQGLFQEYPLIWMLQESNSHKLLQLYQLITNIYSQSLQNQVQYQSILPHLQEGMRQQIKDIKSIQQPYELQKQLFSVIEAMLKTKSIVQLKTVKEIIEFCSAKFHHFELEAVKLMSLIYNFYEERLNQDEKQYLQPDIHRFSEVCVIHQSLDSTMDLEIS